MRSVPFFSSIKLLRLLPIKSPSEGKTGERSSDGELSMNSGCSPGKTNGVFVGDILSVGEMADGILNDGQFDRCQSVKLFKQRALQTSSKAETRTTEPRTREKEGALSCNLSGSASIRLSQYPCERTAAALRTMRGIHFILMQNGALRPSEADWWIDDVDASTELMSVLALIIGYRGDRTGQISLKAVSGQKRERCGHLSRVFKGWNWCRRDGERGGGGVVTADRTGTSSELQTAPR